MRAASGYDHIEIEAKWRKAWEEQKLFETDVHSAERPFYNLMMFPYPSAEGLHVGNVFAFLGSDIYARFMRMQGRDVFEPMGFDAFGMHSENYALKVGTNPRELTPRSIRNFRENQMKMLGAMFDWSHQVETTDPAYYKWTQWIFIQLFRAGLAYKKKSPVNWCPSCKTVLADEQVIGGECERCRSDVGKRDLEQWYFRITKYAQRLLDNLDRIDWSETTKTAQRNWIGRSEGADLVFSIQGREETLTVFTTRPDTIFGATYMVLAPEHPLVDDLTTDEQREAVQAYIEKAARESEIERQDETREKTGSSRGLSESTPPRVTRFPFGFPTMCSWATAPAPSWPSLPTINGISSSPGSSPSRSYRSFHPTGRNIPWRRHTWIRASSSTPGGLTACRRRHPRPR